MRVGIRGTTGPMTVTHPGTKPHSNKLQQKYSDKQMGWERTAHRAAEMSLEVSRAEDCKFIIMTVKQCMNTKCTADFRFSTFSCVNNRYSSQ